MMLEDLISTNIKQRGVGNLNEMKMCKCIKELERIYGIYHGNHQVTGHNVVSLQKTQEDLAKELNITQRQLQRYKELDNLIPELQSLVENKAMKATVGYKIWAKMPQEEQEKFFNEIGRDKIKKLTQKEILARSHVVKMCTNVIKWLVKMVSIKV